MGKHRAGRPPRPAAGAEIAALDTLIDDLTSGDDDRAETAMKALVANGQASIHALESLLDDPDPDHRWWAICTAAQIEEVNPAWLIKALDDESIPVQQAAALGLTIRPRPEAATALIDILSSPDSLLVNLATKALIAIGTDAVPTLVAYLKEQERKNTARLGAVRALAEIADPRAIPVLMDAIEDDSALINHWAEIGLEKQGLDMVYMKLD